MASSYSNDIKLELMVTGEKAGLWGNITNTNLQILEQAASGYLSLAVGGADVNLVLTDGATSNGKNLYFKLTGTLTGNRVVTMPDSSERVFVVEDATDRSTSHYTLTIKTFSGTGVSLPVGSKALLYSDGTNVSSGLLTKGYKSTTSSYTAVDGDQIICDTTGGVLTITLPTGPSVGSEVSFIDGGQQYSVNALTVDPGVENISGSAGSINVSTDNQNFTLVYVNATVGWAYKDNI
jgi:phage baseplate assembly protein gpV|tara:strand:+ start:321 stop:1028 length:708 start_codon:yes stop_codon:yes gene_type:complete